MKYISVLSRHPSQSYQGSSPEEFPCGVCWCLASKGEGRQVWGQGRWQDVPHSCLPRGQGAERSMLAVALAASPTHCHCFSCLNTHMHTHSPNIWPQQCTVHHSAASTAGWSPGLRIGRVGDGEMAFEMDEKGKSDKFYGSGQVGE